MAHPILFVDDDVKLLKSFKRALPKRFRCITAEGPEEGLRILEQDGPLPVIVSDMKMPGMNGIEFFTRSKEISPDSVRILLTGYADQQTAIDAVNKGDLFRFLTKPCDIQTLTLVLGDGLRQYQLISSEKELLEQTLFGTVRVLSQILTLVNPAAQGLAGRLKDYCSHMADALGMEEDKWLYEMAAMLSQLGCLTIPDEILTKISSGGELALDEQEMFFRHPGVAAKLLMHIPRLDEVTEIVGGQAKSYSQFQEYREEKDYPKVYLGAQMLHVATALDRLLMTGLTPQKAIHLLAQEGDEYNPKLVETLESIDFGMQNMVGMRVSCRELNSRMILDEDIHTKKGMLLASKGQHVTEPLIMGMLNYSKTVGLDEPFSVLVPLLDF